VHIKQRKRVKRRGKVARLQASAGGRKLPAGPSPEWLGYYRPIKKAVTLRLDADVLGWFQRQGTSATRRELIGRRGSWCRRRGRSRGKRWTRGVKGQAHGAISLPPTLRKKPRRMGHPLFGLPSEGWATRPLTSQSISSIGERRNTLQLP